MTANSRSLSRVGTWVPVLCFVLGTSRGTWSCDLGVHAKVAAEIAEDFKSPEWAFIEGFASHIALDYVNYGTTLYFDHKTKNSDLLPLSLALNGMTLYQVYHKYKKTKNKQYLYAALGGIAPDLIEAVYRLNSNSDDDHLFPWHDRRKVLFFDEPSGAPGVGRRAAKLNLAMTLAVYRVHF